MATTATTTIEDCRTPGQLVRYLLDAKGWTQRVLALVLRSSEPRINKIVQDRQPISAEMALDLADVFGVPPERFLDLQASYDLEKAKLAARPDPQRATRAVLLGGLPVVEMIKRGWIRAGDIRDVKTVESELTRFFGVDSSDKIEILPHAAKKTQVDGEATPAQIAWIYRVKQIASDMLVPRYSPSGVRSAIKRLRGLLPAAPETRHVPRILAESGIRFVIVESLPSAKIDGVCFWLNDASPVIGMSLRFDRIDNFWFVLRHELEHVLRLHGKLAVALDAELEGDRAGTGEDLPEEERVANQAASDFCVPGKKLDGFIARKQPFFREADIIGFARTIGVHPGIVAGQLQYRTKRYDLFRKHLVKVRSSIARSAMVDGWGDVAPVDM